MTKEQIDEVLLKLKRLVTLYVADGQASWLDMLRWELIPVTMSTLRKDVLGCYSFGQIKLMESLSAQSIFPTYIHELRHRYQWELNPFKYLIGKVYRPLIEKDAVKAEDKARDWMQKNAERYAHID